MRKVETKMVLAFLAFVVIGCSGSSVRMTPIHVEENPLTKPIKDVLIVTILDNPEVRRIFEKHFKDWLNVKGVKAIISADVIPIHAGTKLEKVDLVEIIDKYKNKAILITSLERYDEVEVFNRGRPQFFNNYYGFYNYAWSYVYWPIVYGEKVALSLETRLYDVKTKSLIWAGETQLKNPKTTGQAIGQVVDVVIKDLEKEGFFPEMPSD